MKIQSVEAIPLLARLSQPFQFARIVRTVSSNVVVRMETECGLVGWGEACPVPQLTAETQRSIVEVITERIAPALVGQDPTRRGPLSAEIAATSHRIKFAMAAVDTALLDLTGKIAGLPVAELLGGRFRDFVEVHGSVGWEEDPRDVADNAARSAQRFRWLKFYAGRDTVDKDLQRIEAARDMVGDGHPFLVDVNGLWSVTDVARAAPRLRGAGVHLVEQPVTPQDHAGNATACRILTHEHGIDVAADESVRCSQDVVAVAQASAASVINIGLSKLGGLTPALDAARTARAFGLQVMVGGVVELGLANAAGLHLAALMPEVAAPAYLMGPLKYDRQITAPMIEPVDSTLAVPSAAGLGIEVDETAIKELDARRMQSTDPVGNVRYGAST